MKKLISYSRHSSVSFIPMIICTWSTEVKRKGGCGEVGRALASKLHFRSELVPEFLGSLMLEVETIPPSASPLASGFTSLLYVWDNIQRFLQWPDSVGVCSTPGLFGFYVVPREPRATIIVFTLSHQIFVFFSPLTFNFRDTITMKTLRKKSE